MDRLLGLLRVKVLRGVDLAVRDVCSSDPYVILRMGKQKLKTGVIKKNLNPEWNEELTLSVEDPNLPVKLAPFVAAPTFGAAAMQQENGDEHCLKIVAWAETVPKMETSYFCERVSAFCGPASRRLPKTELLAKAASNVMNVYDKDLFSFDDPMGNAEFDIRPIFEAVKMNLEEGFADGSVITKVAPNRQNCLAEESVIRVENGKVYQDMFLRLRNVESGEIELQLQWIHIPNAAKTFQGS